MILDTFRLDGRVALVTGSSDGLGLGMARGLAQAGARVVLNGRGQVKLQAAAEVLRAEGLAVETCAGDVTDIAQVQALVENVETSVGPIAILVNNAGIQRRGPLQEYPHATWREIMDANLNSAFFVAQAVAQKMISRKSGKIINICSVQSELGRPGIAPYMATKGALKMLTKGMAIDWGPFGLNVNGIGPGYFKTVLNEKLVNDETFSNWLVNRTPSRRWGEIHELAGAAVYLASDASSFCNGHILYVDGGVTAQL
ncbi:MAG: hypothetical protein RLZZ126_840 [Pseudomonadota bacterium]|jgi:gluconate 5-dehydrogenase